MERCGRLNGEEEKNGKMWKTKWKDMERCGRLNGKMWKTKWKEAEDKMERCGRLNGKN